MSPDIVNIRNYHSRKGNVAVKPHADSFYDAHFNLVRASVRELLDEKGKLPTTYANLYTTCRAVVCEARRGEGLYENLRLSMEQCVGKVASQLLALQAHGVAWLGPFVEACEWFERRVVSLQAEHPISCSHDTPEPPRISSSVPRSGLRSHSQRSARNKVRFLRLFNKLTESLK